MKEFDDIDYEPPPYPVFKAYFIPYRENDELLDCRRINWEEDIKLWRGILSKLRDFLRDTLKIVEAGLPPVEKLEFIADMIALFFKIPLLREPLPTVAPSPLKAYLLHRLRISPEKIDVDSLNFVGETFKELHRSQVLSLIEPQLYEQTERCWFIFPADTRPAFNTSGLIPHLLLTSAMAWAIAVERGLSREKAALLRLAAMLHDMGKPFKYHNHVKASREVAETLLMSILPEGDIKRIVNFISTHHGEARTREGGILKEADGAASNLDRMREIAEKIIGDRLRDLAERFGLRLSDAYSSGWESWDFWRSLHERAEIAIEELSREFVKALRERSENYIQLPKEMREIERKPVKGVALARIDLGGIQDFLRRTIELKCVAASSIAMDTLIMAQIPLLLQLESLKDGVWLPYEVFLYSAGGIVELLLPRRLVRTMEETVKRLGEKSEIHGLPLRFAEVTLSTSFTHTVEELSARMQSKKLEVEGKRKKITIIEGREICQFCHQEPAIPNKKIEDRNICKTCFLLYQIGRALHFKKRYESNLFIRPGLEMRPCEVFGIPWDEGEKISASRYMVELVAGHDGAELRGLERGYVRLRDVAALRVDGNLVGAFMATCLSPTDAYERSARIDLALKRAIERGLEALYKGVEMASLSSDEAKRAVASIKLGILYAGGDDAAILTPAWASSIMALILGREFQRNLGGVRGLSIGLAAASARANIWGLLDASHKLMEKAKDGGRRDPRGSFIAFDFITSGSFSGASADARFRILKKRKLSSQPLPIEPCGKRSLKELLSLVMGDCEDYSELFKRAYTLSRIDDERLVGGTPLEDVEREKRRVKRIREVIGKTLATIENLTSERVGEGWDLALLAAHVFARRQIARLEGKEELLEAYKCVRELLPKRLGKGSLLSDADRLIQILGGGVL